jgi:DNA-directed RNA polymerase subunit N (RpoN/RPB10)
VWLFFQPADESARPWQSQVKVVDPEEQEEAISRLGAEGACQRRMLVDTPLVETEQNRSIRVEDLPEVGAGAVSGRSSSDWYHLKLRGTSATPMMVHMRFIGPSAANVRHELRLEASRPCRKSNPSQCGVFGSKVRLESRT